MTLRLLACGSILLISLASPARSQSLGHYHLPSTVPQFCGLGCGAGHHAPMIRPVHCHMPRPPRYIRMNGCGALPLENFPGGYSPGCHEQLDQLLDQRDHGFPPSMPAAPVPITPTEEAAEVEDVSPLPNN